MDKKETDLKVDKELIEIRDSMLKDLDVEELEILESQVVGGANGTACICKDIEER